MANEDQDVNAMIANAISATKIPDPIKTIPEYSGDRTSLFRWLQTVDGVLLAYQNIAHLPIYRVWSQIIRNKITGDADKALVARNAHDWPAVKATLVEYFGDKRDIATITQQIPYLRQGEKSLDDYYHEINQLIADINQKISLDPENVGHVHAIMRVLEPIITTGFIDGLNGNLPHLVRSHEPTSMLEAYKAALSHEQAYVRAREKNIRQGINKSQPRQKGFNSQQKPQNFPQKFQNLSPQNNQNATLQNKFTSEQNPQNFAQNRAQSQNLKPFGNNQGQRPRNPQNFNTDVSMRSRQSHQPMSGISYQSQHLNNAECDEIPLEENCDHFDQFNDDDDEIVDHLNFQLAEIQIPET